MTRKNKRIKTLAASILILGLTSGIALAEQDGPLRMDTNGDQQISQTEFLTSAEQRFAETDVNGDGFLSDDERKAQREERRTSYQDRRFEKTDLNNDGLISKEELEQARTDREAQRKEKRDVNGDGTVDKADWEQIKADREAKKAEHKARREASGDKKRFNPDVNEDGFISLEEHMAASERMFAFLDANDDGVLTKGEGKRRGAKGQRRGGRKGQRP